MKSFLVFVLTVVLFSVAAAQEPMQLKAGPIQLDADRLERSGDENKFTFSGNVRGRSDIYALNADAIDVYFEKDNSIGRIVCRDNVTFTSGAISASADTAELDQSATTIVLTGNAKIKEGATNLDSHVLTINYATKQFAADRGTSGRVRVIFEPDNVSLEQ